MRALICCLLPAVFIPNAHADDAGNIAAVRGMIETIDERRLDDLDQYVAENALVRQGHFKLEDDEIDE